MKIKLNMQIEFENGKIGELELRLLFLISKLGSLKAAAASEGISYKNAWDKLKSASELMGEPLLDASSKKSGAKLTKAGESLLFKWEEFNEFAEKIGDDFHPKMSAQNIIKAPVKELHNLNRGALVGIEYAGFRFYSLISKFGIQELALSLDQTVNFVFKIYSLRYCENGSKVGDNVFSAKVLDCVKLEDDYCCELLLGDTRLKGISKSRLEVGQMAVFAVSNAAIIIML